MKNRKILSILLAVFALTIFSCENWMKDDNLYSDIEYDVKVANAAKIQVFTRYAMTSQGSTSPSGYSTFKVGIPHEISATTDTNYGFVRWAAFSTTYLDTIDQQKNENVIYNSVTEYEENILPNEITAPTVVFENPTSPSTKVTINQSRGDIFIVPLVTARPKVNGTIPDDRETDVVRNSAVRINFTKEMDYDTLKNGISITQGSWVEREDGLYYDYEDISNRFNDPRISSNKKLITFSFAPAYIKTGFDQSAKVTVTISKDVKDVFGFSMVEDEKFVFTPGGTMDSRAPRITQLTGGWKTQFGDFQGMYAFGGAPAESGTEAIPSTAEKLGNKTKIVIKNGSLDAPDTLNDFYTKEWKDSSNAIVAQPFVKNRVGNKVSLRVFAEDLNKEEAAGVVNQEKDEKGVKWVSVRARRLFKNDDGSYYGGDYTDITEKVYSQKGNPAKIGTTSQGTPTYEALVTAAGFTDEDAKNVGCLFEYDLSDLEDGLIQIDVAAEDNVGNNGFYEDEAISNVNGNGYASIFVVKDTTVPTGLVDGGINITVNGASFAEGNYYNRESFENFVVNLTDSVKSSISDAGDSRLSSKKNDIKWTIIQIDDDVTSENLLEQFSGDNVVWKSLDGTIQNEQNSTNVFVAPDEDKADGIRLAYAIKDDMDNINPTIFGKKAKYDCISPEVGTLTWIPDKGITAGVAKGVVIDNQILEIPVTDQTSQPRAFEIIVKPVDENGDEGEAYNNPFAASALEVYKNDTETTFESNEYQITGNTLRLRYLYNGINKILIKGLKIADTASEGKYNIYVKAYDSAGNATLSSPISLSNDSIKPVIEKIYIPGINKAVRATDSSNTPEYWLDSSSDNIQSLIYLKAVYVTLKENNSGAEIFDFTDSTIKLSDNSKVYKVDSNLQPQGAALECTINSSTKFTLAEPIVSQGDGSVTIMITYMLVPNTASANLQLQITDKATNISLLKDKIQSGSNTEISQFGNEVSTTIGNTSFDYLEDQEAETAVPAAFGYTNKKEIKAFVKLGAASSGISELTISGKAKFTSSTKIYDKATSTEIEFDIVPNSNDQTIKFKKNVNSVYVDAIISADIEIRDLCLVPDNPASPDDVYSIKIKGKSFAGHSQLIFSAIKSIILDTTAPAWGSTKGLYTVTYSNAKYENMYPHPKTDKSSEGITFPGSEDLYFYRSSYIRIDPKVVDDNPILDGNDLPIVRWTGPGITNYSDYSYFYGRYTGEFTVTIYDKAGNASPVRNFHVVNVTNVVTTDDSRKDIEKLEHDVELIVPTGVDKDKNTFLNGVRTIISSNLYAYNYILKKVDGNYQLKIPLHSYAAADVNTAPIEKYGLTYNYRCYPSTASGCSADSYIPKNYPNSLPESAWHDYGTSSQPTESNPATDDNLQSYVDSNGDIIVTLPQDYCNPVSLLLRDACGNMKFILLNPGLKTKLGGSLTVCEQNADGTVDAEKVGLRNQAVGWLFDDRVGVSDAHAGTEKLCDTDNRIITTTGDVIFYNNADNKTPLLKLESCSDSVRFVPAQTGVGDSDNYTMKSRLLVWKNNNAQGTNPPKQSDFEAASAVGSDWYYYKEFYKEATSVSSAFTLQNTFPEYDNDTHETSAYELWYIVEDRVGNANIKQITYKNANNVSKGKWLYDVTPPTLEVTTANKVNYLADTETNYYSANSSVKYTIIDKQSGIAKDGTDTAYSPANPVYQLSEKDLSLEEAVVSGNKLYVENVEDWAGNKAESQGLENHGSTKWVKLDKPNPSVTLSITPYKIRSAGTNSGVDTDLRTASAKNITNVSDTNPFQFKAMSEVVKVSVAFNTDDTNLLGWVIKDSQISDYESKFYDATSSEIKQNLVFEKKKNNKWDNSTSWERKVKYCYPVNKAGILGAPVTVTMELNERPTLQEGTSLTYSPETSYVTYTNSNATEKINFIKSGATINFTSNIPVTTAKIVVYDPSDTNTEVATLEAAVTAATDADNNMYYATLLNFKDENGNYLSSYLDTPRLLKFMISTGSENSVQMNMNYPATNGFNNWCIDNSAPVISLDSVKTQSGSEQQYNVTLIEGTYFLRCNNGIVTFTSSANDIEKFQWSEQPDTGFTTTGLTYDVSAKTCTFASPETSKTYYFRAVDKAGNASSPVYATFKKDNTGPTGSITYAVNNSSGSAATGAFLAAPSDDGKTVTITFNPSVAKKIKLTPNVSDNTGGAGMTTSNYLYIHGSSGDTLIDSNTFDLPSSQTTYAIIAKDKVGNSSETLLTIVCKPYSTAPAPLTEKTDVPFSYLFDDNNTSTNIGTYNGNRINGFGQNTSFTISPDPDPSNSNINKITDSAHQNWIIRAIAQNSTINLPLKADTLITNTVYYKIQICSVQHRPASTEFTAPASGWTSATVGDNGIISVPITTAQLADRNTFIFVWLKDEIGNISVYNIPYPKSVGENWWTADTTGPSGSVEYALKKDSADDSNYTVSTSGSTVTVTYNHALGFVNKLTFTPTLNDSDGVGVDSLYYKKGDGALQQVSDNSISLDDSYSTYEIYAKDKLGNQSTLLRKFVFVKDDTAPTGTVSFTPKQNGTAVTQSSTTYTLTQSDDKYTLTYVKTESSATVDSVTIAFTNTSSDLKSITMQVNGNTQTFTNGTYDFNISSITSKQTFNIVATDNCGNTKTWQLELDPVAALPGNGEGGGTNPNRISTSPFSGNIDTSALTGGSAPAAAQGPGITINNNMNFEVPAVVAGSAGTSRAAKKAAKKAAKAAKAAAKQTPVVQEIAAQVEEIAELTEIAEITEIAELATPVAKDQLAMVLPKTANTKQIETQVSVETSLVETTTDTYEETVHDDLVFKLIVAIASLVLCGVFGLTMLLKRKRA